MPRRTATVPAWWLLSGALVLLGHPRAGLAFEEPGPDAAGLGRGGAVAAAEDLPGPHVWNPALVPRGTALGPRLMLDLRVDVRQVTVRRWDDQHTFHSPLEPKVLPDALLLSPLGVLHLWGGVWARVRRDREAWFPGQDPDSPWVPGKDDLQRYGALRYRSQESEYGLSLAFRPGRWLSLGTALVGRSLHMMHERVLWAGTEALLGTQPESTNDDLRIRISLRDPLVPEGRFGLLLRPLAQLRLGLSFALPGVARLQGQASLPPLPSGRVITLDGTAAAALRLRLPWVLRAALGVDVGRISLDVQVTQKDALRPRRPRVRTLGLLIHRVESPTEQVPVATVALGPVFQRQLTLATGLRILAVRPWFELSLGYAFSQGARDPAYASATLVDPDRHALTAGLSLRRGALRLDVGYARILAGRRGGPGLARQENPVDPTASSCISSGRESRHGDLAAASLTWVLDPRPW